MRPLIASILFIITTLPVSSFAEIKTVTQTVKQPFGGSQSPDDARTSGIAKAKREALEQFGTYIESTTVIKNSHFDSDEIMALTAGVTKAEVIKQQNYIDGDAFGIEITVKVDLDDASLEKSLQRLLEDRNHLKELKLSRERERNLLTRLAELEIENQRLVKSGQDTSKLKKEFQGVSQGITAEEWFNKANTLWDGKKYTDPNKVIEYLTQSIRLDPNRAAGSYQNRGQVYSQIKQLDLAIADYDQAIRIDPNHVVAFYNRGVAYGKLKQLDRAIADYDQVIRLDPNFVNAYINRGNIYNTLKQPDRALVDFNKVISLDPKNALAYNNRGLSYKALKQLNLAMADYTQAIYFDPNDGSAYNNRGIEYLRAKEFNQGCSDVKKACELGVCSGLEVAKKFNKCQ